MKDCIDCYNLRKAAKKILYILTKLKSIFTSHTFKFFALNSSPLIQFPPQGDSLNRGGFHAAGAVFRVPFDDTRIVPASVFAACDFRAVAELAAAPMSAE